MIIGLDWFGQAEYAHTIDHNIRDWLIPCAPTNEWTLVDGLTGKCQGDNTSEHWGCFEIPDFYPPTEVDENGVRRWHDYFRSRSEQP
jgi:hypothetical protein